MCVFEGTEKAGKEEKEGQCVGCMSLYVYGGPGLWGMCVLCICTCVCRTECDVCMCVSVTCVCGGPGVCGVCVWRARFVCVCVYGVVVHACV